MNKFATRFALLALVGTMTAAGPALAAPPPGNGSGPMVDCKDPANANSPMCMHMHKGGTGPNNSNGPGNGQANGNGPDFKKGPDNGNSPGNNNGPGNGNGPDFKKGNGNGPFDNNNGPGNGNGPDFKKGPFNGNGPGMGGPGMGHPGNSGQWDRHDRDQFRGFFRSFNFAFGAPDFDIRPGVRVPRHFNLRPLPPQIFRYYPYYRGFLFFETRDGSIVIVDPRSYRIVDII